MGTFIGHILPGAGFLLLGLWHLYNTIGSHLGAPGRFKNRTWFHLRGFPRLRHAELYFIMAGSCLSIAGEMLPDRFTSVAEHLNNFEHATISLTLFIYAAFALATDALQLNKNLPRGCLHMMATFALGQELLLFHFHSADHMGLEGQYHWLLQLPIAVGILTLLAGIFESNAQPILTIVRSTSLVVQGVWFIIMGFVLWTPSLLPKGCKMGDDHVDCPEPADLMSAKSLANLEFAWLLTSILFLTAFVYIAVTLQHRRQQVASRYQYSNLDGPDRGESLAKDVFKIVDDIEHGGDSSPPHSMERGFDGFELER